MVLPPAACCCLGCVVLPLENWASSIAARRGSTDCHAPCSRWAPSGGRHVTSLTPTLPGPPLAAESRRRFSLGKDAEDKPEAATSSKPAIGGGLRSHLPSAACLASGEGLAEDDDDAEEEESQSQRLGRTVEQLRELVQQGGEAACEWVGRRA